MLIHYMIMKIDATTIVSIVVIIDIVAVTLYYILLYPLQEQYRYLLFALQLLKSNLRLE